MFAINGRHFHYSQVVSPDVLTSSVTRVQSSKAIMLVKVNDRAHGRVKWVPLGLLSQFSRAFNRQPWAQLAPHQTHSALPLCVGTSWLVVLDVDLDKSLPLFPFRCWLVVLSQCCTNEMFIFQLCGYNIHQKMYISICINTEISKTVFLQYRYTDSSCTFSLSLLFDGELTHPPPPVRELQGRLTREHA